MVSAIMFNSFSLDAIVRMRYGIARLSASPTDVDPGDTMGFSLKEA